MSSENTYWTSAATLSDVVDEALKHDGLDLVLSTLIEVLQRETPDLTTGRVVTGLTQVLSDYRDRYTLEDTVDGLYVLLQGLGKSHYLTPQETALLESLEQFKANPPR